MNLGVAGQRIIRAGDLGNGLTNLGLDTADDIIAFGLFLLVDDEIDVSFITDVAICLSSLGLFRSHVRNQTDRRSDVAVDNHAALYPPGSLLAVLANSVTQHILGAIQDIADTLIRQSVGNIQAALFGVHHLALGNGLHDIAFAVVDFDLVSDLPLCYFLIVIVGEEYGGSCRLRGHCSRVTICKRLERYYGKQHHDNQHDAQQLFHSVLHFSNLLMICHSETVCRVKNHGARRSPGRASGLVLLRHFFSYPDDTITGKRSQ